MRRSSAKRCSSPLMFGLAAVFTLYAARRLTGSWWIARARRRARGRDLSADLQLSEDPGVCGGFPGDVAVCRTPVAVASGAARRRRRPGLRAAARPRVLPWRRRSADRRPGGDGGGWQDGHAQGDDVQRRGAPDAPAVHRVRGDARRAVAALHARHRAAGGRELARPHDTGVRLRWQSAELERGPVAVLLLSSAAGVRGHRRVDALAPSFPSHSSARWWCR